MKKIISFALALVLALTALSALCACGLSGGGGSADPHIAEINAMFERLVPTQTVTKTTLKAGALTLSNEATLTVGTVDGKKAATYITNYEELAPLDGGNDANVIRPKTEKLWYVEGKGTCKNGTNGEGRWDPEGADFSPKAGDIRLVLDPNMLLNYAYDEATETFTATMDKDNATQVLSNFLAQGHTITSGLSLTITTAGGRVTSLKLEYSKPSDEIYVEGVEDPDTGDDATITVPEELITVEIHYSYDAKVITLK